MKPKQSKQNGRLVDAMPCGATPVDREASVTTDRNSEAGDVISGQPNASTELMTLDKAASLREFTVFYYENALLVRSWVRKTLPRWLDSAEGSDLVQIIFFALAFRAPVFQCDSEKRAWLFTVARNASLNLRRKRREITNSEAIDRLTGDLHE